MKSISLAAFAALSAMPAAFSAEQQLVVALGSQENLKLSYEVCANLAECVKVGNSRVVRAQYSPTNRELIVFAVGNGETSITVRDRQGAVADVYSVFVSDVNYPRISKEVADLLKGIQSITVKTLPGSVVIDGELTKIQDLQRVNRVASMDLYRGKVTSLAHPAEPLKKAIAEQIQREIQHTGAKVRSFGEGFVLEGTVKEEGAAQSAASLARNLMQALMPWAPKDVVVSKIEVRR